MADAAYALRCAVAALYCVGWALCAARLVTAYGSRGVAVWIAAGLFCAPWAFRPMGRIIDETESL